jgi:hypothetical protein
VQTWAQSRHVVIWPEAEGRFGEAKRKAGHDDFDRLQPRLMLIRK